jgi:hypothetical protein
MLNSLRSMKSIVRFATISLVFALALGFIGCSSLVGVKRPVKVHPLLTPLQNANTEQLVAEVNRLAAVKSIRGKVDLQFQDTSFAESGIAEKYRTADGTVTVQRPGQILLVIQVPFISTDVAQMTSDGTRFRVAILQGDQKYRRFVMGTNEASYPEGDKVSPTNEKVDKDKMAVQTQRAVSVLSNLRPQHFTEALLVNPIKVADGTGYVYAQSETYEDEPDTRLQANKNARVVRGYYMLDELSPSTNGFAKVIRRFWFDRVGTGGPRLARMQNYDGRGVLITDVVYGELRPFGGQAVMLPSTIELTRPQDRYKISINYQAPESVKLDNDYRPEAFVLENKWGLPEKNLDEAVKKPVPANR